MAPKAGSAICWLFLLFSNSNSFTLQRSFFKHVNKIGVEQRRAKPDGATLNGRIVQPPKPVLKIGGTLDDVPCILECYETKRKIECFFDASVEIGRDSYHLFHPINQAVAIVSYDRHGDAIPLDPDSQEMYKIFPSVKQLFKDDKLELIHSAGVLTLIGDMDDVDDDEDGNKFGDAEEVGEVGKDGMFRPKGSTFGFVPENQGRHTMSKDQFNKGKGNDGDGDSNEPDEVSLKDLRTDGTSRHGGDAVEVLADFEVADKKYSLVKLLETISLIGRKDGSYVGEGAEFRYTLLDKDENRKVGPYIEKALSDHVDKAMTYEGKSGRR
jgi:hypothetical protein